jgi:hypothetical protein
MRVHQEHAAGVNRQQRAFGHQQPVAKVSFEVGFQE